MQVWWRPQLDFTGCHIQADPLPCHFALFWLCLVWLGWVVDVDMMSPNASLIFPLHLVDTVAFSGEKERELSLLAWIMNTEYGSI